MSFAFVVKRIPISNLFASFLTLSLFLVPRAPTGLAAPARHLYPPYKVIWGHLV
jgi:hypothetical protein